MFFLASKHLKLLILVIIYFAFSAQLTHAQKQKKIALIDFNTTDTYLVKMKDESTFTGKFVEKTGNRIVFVTASSSKIELMTEEIATVSVIDVSRYKNGKYWFVNPHHTRYLFSPSAFNLKQGEGYFQNIYGVVNSVNYGFSDHFTLGAGTEIISLFSGYPVLMLTPKLGGYKIGPKWAAGGGAFLLAAEDGLIGIGYGIITQGTEDRNITFGLGWAFTSEGSLESKPVATISGMTRLSKNIAFISENWLIPFDGYTPFISYGLRFFGENLAVDLALVNSPEIIRDIIPIGIPYVDFVYKF